MTYEEILQKVGVSCDVYWKKGDLRKGTKIKEKFHGCSIKSKLEKDSELIQHIETLLAGLEGAAEKFKSISGTVDILLSCVIYSDAVPALYFEKEIIEKISSFGANFDIDLYLMEK